MAGLKKRGPEASLLGELEGRVGDVEVRRPGRPKPARRPGPPPPVLCSLSRRGRREARARGAQGGGARRAAPHLGAAGGRGAREEEGGGGTHAGGARGPARGGGPTALPTRAQSPALPTRAQSASTPDPCTDTALPTRAQSPALHSSTVIALHGAPTSRGLPPPTLLGCGRQVDQLDDDVLEGDVEGTAVATHTRAPQACSLYPSRDSGDSNLRPQACSRFRSPRLGRPNPAPTGCQPLPVASALSLSRVPAPMAAPAVNILAGVAAMLDAAAVEAHGLEAIEGLAEEVLHERAQQRRRCAQRPRARALREMRVRMCAVCAAARVCTAGIYTRVHVAMDPSLAG
eukprot:7391055-Prymnesium_polylepis.1